MYEDLPIFQYLRDNYSDYAVNKIRYNSALGLNNWSIKQEDKTTFVVHMKEPYEEDEESPHFPKQDWWKLKVFNSQVFCTCLDYFSSGIPCPHQMLVSIKKHLKVPVHCRWSKQFSKLLNEMDGSARNERVEKIAEQHYWEQKFISDSFSKSVFTQKTGKEAIQ